MGLAVDGVASAKPLFEHCTAFGQRGQHKLFVDFRNLGIDNSLSDMIVYWFLKDNNLQPLINPHLVVRCDCVSRGNCSGNRGGRRTLLVASAFAAVAFIIPKSLLNLEMFASLSLVSDNLLDGLVLFAIGLICGAANIAHHG